jgi:hypothetical protein
MGRAAAVGCGKRASSDVHPSRATVATPAPCFPSGTARGTIAFRPPPNPAMNNPDHEYDPDDNFAGNFEAGMEVDDDDTTEALVWQLLLLINPGDEDTALQQFDAYREMEEGDADTEPVWRLKDLIDWRSGFYVDASDRASLVDSLTELAARWNLRIDWGVEDPTDAEFLASTDVPTLMQTAYDRLREYDYTLWTWNTAGGPGDDDVHAGWITLSRDDEAMQAVAAALEIELHRGNDAF